MTFSGGIEQFVLVVPFVTANNIKNDTIVRFLKSLVSRVSYNYFFV